MDWPLARFGIQLAEDCWHCKLRIHLFKCGNFVWTSLQGFIEFLAGRCICGVIHLFFTKYARLEHQSVCSLTFRMTPCFSIFFSSHFRFSWRWMEHLWFTVLLQVELGHPSEVSQRVELAWICLLQSFHSCNIWFGPEVITVSSD